MHRLTSTSIFDGPRGTVFYVRSPIRATRAPGHYITALGPITLDGKMVKTVLAVEWHPLLPPVQIGEEIGLIVEFEEAAPEADSFDKIIAEMRERRVNNGKQESATLVAWADRLAAIQAEQAKTLALGMAFHEKLRDAKSGVPADRFANWVFGRAWEILRLPRFTSLRD